ncbi:MAG: DUF624 domain-containing protein [Oscillospiraceae bacterium]|nr:DUF624 domain-containing protein [Oscillospiraceae bacterium]
MGLFSKYEEPGKGVPKNPDQKLPFFRLFELYFGHFSKLILLNFIYIICFLPMFAGIIVMQFFISEDSNLYYLAFYLIVILCGIIIGPATCAMAKLCRNMSIEKPTFLWHDFWGAFKVNFKQGAIMGIIDMLFISAVSVSFPMYYNMAESNNTFYIPFAVCLICSVIFLMMHFYIYFLIVTTDLGLWKILKNSFLLTAIDIKSSVINLVVTAIVLICVVIFFPYTAILIIILPTFMAFLYAFNCYPVIRKYVIQPYYDERGERNPELDYVDEDGETVFVDAPELEEAPPKEKSGRIFPKRETSNSSTPRSSGSGKKKKTIR